MSRFQLLFVLACTAGLITVACGQGPTQSQAPAEEAPVSQPPTTPEQKIQNAMSAAPAGIARDATIMDWPATPDGPMVELRPGTNNWTCLPALAHTPANDPMCMDQAAMQWAEAWAARQPPQMSGIGIGYMLQGGATPDNDDPFATEPKEGSDWVMEPPHLMLFGVSIPPGAYPTEPDTRGPWVMWGGTPYEHLMVPVQ